ncbi:hypothetical protein KSP40_PGU018983 [Platanthera guangdongensis]|uniref:XS domain-containing protein n=1 Tax=Platanthera guangdongensis TaxID=2320717 RepID=A0ABR2MGU8_9ASPA
MKGRRSDWRGDPIRYRSRRRSPLIGDKRRNLSQKRPHRSSGRRSASNERKQDHPLRHSDHGKDPVQGHSLPPQHMAHLRHGSPPPAGDNGFRFQQNSLLPDQPLSNPTWRLSPAINHREFYSQISDALPSSTLSIDEHHMFPQKPTYVHEGSSRLFYSDQPMVSSTILDSERSRTSGDGVARGIRENEIHSFNDRHRAPYDGSIGMEIQDIETHPYTGLHRDQHDTDKKQVYSKDLSFPQMPPSHPRTFLIAPSSSILKEEFKGLHHDRIPDGLAPGIRRYPNEPLEHYSIRDISQPDTLRRDLPDPLRRDLPDPLRRELPDPLRRDLPDPLRRDLPDALRRDLQDPLRRDLQDDSLAYDYDDLHPRRLDDHQHRVQEELYKRIPPPRRNATSSTIMDYNEGWMEKDDSTNRTSMDRIFLGHRDSVYRDFTHDYRDVGAQQELGTNSDNWHGGLRTKSIRDYETVLFEEDFTSEKEYFPASYREKHRNRRSLLSDHDLDQHRLVVSTHNRSLADELSDYDVERMDRRQSSIYGNVDESDSDVFGEDEHSYAPYKSKEIWLAEGPTGLPLSNSMLSEHSRYRKFSRTISRSDASMTRGASSMHAKNDHNINLMRRLKRVRSEFHGSSSSKRRQDLLSSSKYGKRTMHERLGAQGGGSLKSGSHFPKNDPPENSEEFRQQVHKAFLRYSKLLNESPHSRRIYQNQGNSHSLMCCVCGSSSKEFADIKNLVMHTYHSLKVGLKTEHLGFHKSLCVLFGWNWRVPPDASMAYQSMPVTEAEAIREDLILWPPLVIIHNNSSTGSGSNNDAKDVTVEGLEKILRDMGFGPGMTGACLGKLTNKGIFAVKFMPTFSGLQEAQRLHNHFSAKKRGKQEFRSNGKRNPDDGEIPSVDSDATLYGYMAVAEDLDKLSEGTKKRCLVKSRKDIQAIVDAPLNTAD